MVYIQTHCYFFLSQYNDLDLYTQLCYYQHIFDVKKAMNQISPGEKGKKNS